MEQAPIEYTIYTIFFQEELNQEKLAAHILKYKLNKIMNVKNVL
jgi:hypothetical protein